MAKLGEKKQHHFSHKVKNGCSPATANETGLHSLAKEIIRENRSILVPGFKIAWYEVIPEKYDINLAAEVDIKLPDMRSRVVEYDSVEIEKSIEGIVADAVITVQGITCIVEVAVTHFVDEIKKAKLKEIGRSALEIDLSGLLKGSPTREEITTAVLSDETNRNWVFNPLREQRLREKKDEFQRKYDEVAWKQEQAEERKLEYREINVRALQELMDPDNYKKELERIRNDEQAAKKLKWFHFSKVLTEYPFYTDIPITGEFVFSCDRRIWQGKLFDDYVYRRFGQEYCIFSIGQIQKRIFKGKMMIQYDQKKTYHTLLTINGQKQEVSFSYSVVRRYFDYLELLGFLWHVGYQWQSDRPISADPLNHQTADILKDILESVDCSSPDIDEIIKRELLTRLGEKDKKIVLEWD